MSSYKHITVNKDITILYRNGKINVYVRGALVLFKYEDGTMTRCTNKYYKALKGFLNLNRRDFKALQVAF